MCTQWIRANYQIERRGRVNSLAYIRTDPRRKRAEALRRNDGPTAEMGVEKDRERVCMCVCV